MAMSIANTYLPLYHNAPTASHLSRISLLKSLPTPLLKQRRKSGAFTTYCSTADAAKDPINLKFSWCTACVSCAGYEAFPTLFDIHEISKLLPHRFPFLLVDRVVEYTPGGLSAGVGIKNITINENYFAGHFPGKPIVPDV